MTLFAGVYAVSAPPRDATAEMSSLSQRITDALGRGDDPITTFDAPGFFLAKLDVDAFRERAFWVSPDNNLAAALCGEPLLGPLDGNAPSRAEDLRSLSVRFPAEGADSLRDCHGAFTFCRYDRREHEVVLATDKLGVRPLYYYLDHRFLVFASALRILEQLAFVPKRMDLRGVTEMVVIGYPLADRTPYVDVRVLRSAECLRISRGTPQRSRYFRWDDVPPTGLTRSEALEAVHERFTTAVAYRSARSDDALSFLSGGLDSRCVVAALSSLKKRVATIAVDYDGSPDRPIADLFAARLGTRHAVIRGMSQVAPHSLLPSPGPADRLHAQHATSFRQLVFSGDGGSVGMGHVYLDDELIDQMRRGRLKDAASKFLGCRALSRKLLRHDVFPRLESVPVEGILAELHDIRSCDPARSFFVFLLTNDQSRHLHFVYEDIDVHRMEYLAPFLDSRHLELIVSLPVEWFLRHDFYYEWLTRFAPAVAEVPWQAYPGHLPCPLPTRQFGPTQFESAEREGRRDARRRLARCREFLFDRSFASPLMRRSAVAAACMLQWSGLKDCSHVISAYLKYQEYFHQCDGRIRFPEREDPLGRIGGNGLVHAHDGDRTTTG